MSQKNIERNNGGPGTILGMQSPTKSTGLRCQQARGAGPWPTPSGVPSGTRQGPFCARGPIKARLRSRDDECKLFGLAAKGLLAALLSVSIQLAGAPVIKAEPRARHVPAGEVDALSFQSKEQPGRSGVVGVKTLRRVGFTGGTVEPSARPKLALQEPEGSGSDPGPPSTLELITLVLLLVVLAELCGGAIAERRRARPASGAAATREGARSPLKHRAPGPRPIAPADETVDNPRYLVDLMTASQKRSYRALLAVWIATVVAFWIWWLQSDHWVTPAAMVVISAMIFFKILLLAGWFFFFTNRMKRPNPSLPIPRLRTAIIVTKAPSEPWVMLTETLDGMLRQDYPYPYDVWLADESPSPETLRWCEEHSVKVSCREGVEGYHRPTWPRRTRCKEGNLAYFYDHWGYRDYDVVAQLDADHVPTPGYLREMVRPFGDPTVGYVAAPSVCDKNATESWAARGRLYAEAPLHGAQQAGYSGKFAPSCIGSHYAVRTAALEEVGGLGPELAEDFSTTLMLASHDWRGVFAIDAMAHGDGPSTFAECIVQEYQWSRSLTNILLQVSKRYWGGLGVREKVKLLYNQVWYPSWAFLMLMALVFPVAAILTDTPWVGVPLLEFFIRAGLVGLAGLAIFWWLRRQGYHRPADAKLFSWETFLFTFTRWPWVLWGVVQAFAGWVSRKQFTWKVTPKRVTRPRRLPLVALLPYPALALACAAAAIIMSDPGSARGYYWACLTNALIYSVVTAAVVIVHVRENRAQLTVPLFKFAGVQLAAAAAVALAVATAFVLRGRDAYEVLTVTEGRDSVTAAVAWFAHGATEINAPAGSPGLILVALALVMTTWTLVPLARARRPVRSASAASLALLAAGLTALGVWSGELLPGLLSSQSTRPSEASARTQNPPAPAPAQSHPQSHQSTRAVRTASPSPASSGSGRGRASASATSSGSGTSSGSVTAGGTGSGTSNGTGSGSGTSNGSGSGTTDSQGSNPTPTAPQPVQPPSTPSTPPSTSQGQSTTPTTAAPPDSPGNVPSGSGGPGQLP
jgi:cellulose synthase (UDP-forming)